MSDYEQSTSSSLFPEEGSKSTPSGGILSESEDQPEKGRRRKRRSGRPKKAGVASRFGGLIATLLGLVGILLSIAMLWFVFRLAIGASSTADELADPIRSSVDRLEDRIDETDDLVGRGGIQAQNMNELRARADSLADLSAGARRGFSLIEDHPIYGQLPAEMSELDSALQGFETSSSRITELVGQPGDQIETASADEVGDELNAMQSKVSDIQSVIDSATSSLKTWLRLGAFAGIGLALWSLWAQFCLLRRGLRGLRGQRI